MGLSSGPDNHYPRVFRQDLSLRALSTCAMETVHILLEKQTWNKSTQLLLNDGYLQASTTA